MSTVAIVGASGFVGSALAQAASSAGLDVVELKAPRLRSEGDVDDVTRQLADRLRGTDVVVNCAGNPDASAPEGLALTLANGVLPGVVGAAATSACVPRYIHVSSAVVQGRRPVLDASLSFDAFSAYARSKIAGEHAALRAGPGGTTVYRPPSVHAASRRVTSQLTRLARSPLSTVAAPGTLPTPQTHILDVASALMFLALSDVSPPQVVHHPWQGHTTSGLLLALGGRPPRRVPAVMCRGILGAGRVISRIRPPLAPVVRRVEMVWFGQPQAESWLTTAGWHPTTTLEDWARLGDTVSASNVRPRVNRDGA